MKIYKITGMGCASCALKIEKHFQKFPGVTKAQVNFSLQKLYLEFDASRVNFSSLRQEIRSLGEYDITNLEDNKSAQNLRQLKRRTIFALIFSIPLMYLAMSHHISFLQSEVSHLLFLQFLLATPVIFYAGFPFFRSALVNLKHGSSDMNTLVAMGTGSAYLFSVIAFFFPDFLTNLGITPHLYFEVAAVIIAFVLLGKFCEERARAATGSAIEKLLALHSKSCTIIQDGKTIESDIEAVQKGMILLVKPGERVPVDGIVLDAEPVIDESAFTGESIPVTKKKGDKALAGTINVTASFQLQATQVGKETMLSRIIALVEEAQGSKAAVQRLADRVAAIFVPSVLVIALMTFALWWYFSGFFSRGLEHFIAVVIVACPCALGLATPAAITVAIGKGAEHGILIKNAHVLEQLEQVDTIVFDKTGTLTVGKPSVEAICPFGEISEEKLLALCASIENNSQHPLAQAIVKEANKRNLPLDHLTEITDFPGKGISSGDYLLGTESFLRENGVTVSDARIEELHRAGKSIVLVAKQKKYLGLIALSDTEKSNSKNVVEQLKKKGMGVIMLTGDNPETAQWIAKKVGITTFAASLLPQDKAQYISRLRDQGKIVAMAGDGVNDALALAKAHIGIAIESGSDIAKESADITIMRDNLEKILSALELSKQTMRAIRQNLFWAFFYNIVAIPIAAGVFYFSLKMELSPAIASLTMAFSSVSVVGNSLRLKWKKIGA